MSPFPQQLVYPASRISAEIVLVMSLCVLMFHWPAATPFAGVSVCLVIAGILRYRQLPWRTLGFGRMENGVWSCFDWYLYTLSFLYLSSIFIFYLVEKVVPGLLAGYHVPEPFPVTGLKEGSMILVKATYIGVTEEIIFRGFLLTWLITAFRHRGAAILLASLAFALFHLYQGPMGVLITAWIGGILGMVYVRTKSLWLCIALHCTVDLIAFTEALSFPVVLIGLVVLSMLGESVKVLCTPTVLNHK